MNRRVWPSVRGSCCTLVPFCWTFTPFSYQCKPASQVPFRKSKFPRAPQHSCQDGVADACNTQRTSSYDGPFPSDSVTRAGWRNFHTRVPCSVSVLCSQRHPLEYTHIQGPARANCFSTLVAPATRYFSCLLQPLTDSPTGKPLKDKIFPPASLDPHAWDPTCPAC